MSSRDRFWALAAKAVAERWATADDINALWDSARGRRWNWRQRLEALRDLLELEGFRKEVG